MPPLAAGAHEVKEAIQQLSYIRGPRPPTGLGARDKRLQQAELVVRQCLAGAKVSNQQAISRRSLIAARLSRPECCPARVTVLSAVSRAAATSGSVRRTGIARSTTGLRVIACPRPRPRNCLHPRPGATRLS
jgi:hypothetical protein